MQNQTKQGFLLLSDVCFQLLNPVLRKRTGVGIKILESWTEIVGKELSDITYPFRLNWPSHKQNSNEKSRFIPGTLVIACEARAGIILQHISDRVIQSLERILGPATINRIKTITKPFYKNKILDKKEWLLSQEEQKFLNHIISGIEDNELRKTLFNLGKMIIAEKNKSI